NLNTTTTTLNKPKTVRPRRNAFLIVNTKSNRESSSEIMEAIKKLRQVKTPKRRTSSCKIESEERIMFQFAIVVGLRVGVKLEHTNQIHPFLQQNTWSLLLHIHFHLENLKVRNMKILENQYHSFAFLMQIHSNP